jgi:hypothetical protein
MSKLTQSQFIYKYNDSHREQFNPALFMRSDDKIIEQVIKVIKSCERDQFFVIKVHSYRVVDDYSEIMTLLYNYEENMSKNKKKKKENVYEHINLKDSAIKLIVVTYYISIKDKSEYVDVLIAVPRYVDKYYFRISGNIYSAMFQIVDGSTYNNSTSNSKKHSITLKTISMPIRIYRNFYSIKTSKKQDMVIGTYTSRIFNKSFNAIKYILAKYGLYQTFGFLGIHCVYLTQQDPQNEDYYTFKRNDSDIYISVPKYIFDRDILVQSLAYTIYYSIAKDTKFEDLFNNTFWLVSLGGEFSNYSVEKGTAILDSLESIYDLETKDTLHLPYEYKETIYHVLRWMIREFSNLKLKDNLDISTKKIRDAEYIASLYAMKLSKGIYRVADIGKKADILSIRKAIVIPPMYLLGAITKCRLVNYRNLVNDLDSIVPLEYTYKGIAGIGEQSNNSVPDIYRSIHISQLGRTDLDDSPKSDPGMSGTICPLTKLYGNSFSEYTEPNFYEQEFSQLMNEYKALVGLKEVVTFKKNILGEEDNETEQIIDGCIETAKKLIKPVYFVEVTTLENTRELLEGGGLITYEC